MNIVVTYMLYSSERFANCDFSSISVWFCQKLQFLKIYNFVTSSGKKSVWRQTFANV